MSRTKRILTVVSLILLLLTVFLQTQPAKAAGEIKGIFLSANDGVYAQISTGVRVPNGLTPPNFGFTAMSPDVDQFFEFTIYPDGSCVEAGVQHYKAANNATNEHYFYIHDWCNSNSNTQVTLATSNTTFRASYVTEMTFNDYGTTKTDEVIIPLVVQHTTSPNEWGVYLYDFPNNEWDLYDTSSGTPPGSGQMNIIFANHGGTMDGGGAYCPMLNPWGILEFRNIHFRQGYGNWYAVGSGDVNYYDDSMYCFTNNIWKVTKPNPTEWRITPYSATY